MKAAARKTKDLFDNELVRSLFDTNERNAILSTLQRTGIAEEEINEAKRRFPCASEELHAAFLLLCPTPPLSGLSDRLFREHCREILERVANGADVRTGTDAELLAVLSQASQVSPLTRPAALCYERLFERRFPDEWSRVFAEATPRTWDSYDEEQVAELEAQFRRKLSHNRTP